MNLPNELLQIILSYAQFYSQDRLALVCKQLYTQYCAYRKTLWALDQIYFTDSNCYVLVYNNGITDCRSFKKIPNTYYSCNETMTEIYSLLTHLRHYKYVYAPSVRYVGFIHLLNNKANCYVDIYYDELSGNHIKNGTVNKFFDMKKYSKARHIDCPNVLDFTGYSYHYLSLWPAVRDFSPYRIDIINFSHESSNYCSIKQCAAEMISLSNFLNGRNNSDIVNENYSEMHLKCKERTDKIRQFNKIMMECSVIK